MEELLFALKFRTSPSEVPSVKCFLTHERPCYEERREEHDMDCLNDSLK